MASQYEISGIDVAHHQGDVDFLKAAESGQRFAILKATEGEDYLDPRFVENWGKLMELDGTMYRGAYHFARPDSVGGAADGAAEASDFCDVLEAVGGYMTGAFPPALDYEKYSGKGVEANIAFIDAFVKTVEDRLGRSPMIYTGYKIWRYQTDNSDAWTHLPLWLVKYTSRDYPTTAMDELPWDDFALWQWSGGGDVAYGPKVPGIPPDPGTADLNWFDGDEAALAALAMVETGTDPIRPPADIGKMYKLLAKAERAIEEGLTCIRAVRRAIEAEVV